MFMDNVSSHVSDIPLKSVTVHLFPPNTTSRLQPLDQGIIQACKQRYRTRLLQRVIANIESGVETKTDLKDAVFLIARSWGDVIAETTSNCFRKAGFNFSEVQITEQVEPAETGDPGRQNEEHRNIWDFVSKNLNVPASENFENYIQCDSRPPVDDTNATESQIIQTVMQTDETEDVTVDEEEDQHDEEKPEDNCTTSSQALSHIRGLRSYLELHKLAGFDDLNKLEDIVTNQAVRAAQSLTQSKLTQFFQ